MDDIDFKEEYIDRKIEGLDANKASLIEKNVFITALGIAGTLALGGAAFMFGKLVTQIAVTLALFDAVIPVVTIMTDVYRNNQLKQIEKEMKHLKTLKKQGIKSTKELDRKRLEKINEYEEKFKTAISNDLNTASMLTLVYEVLKEKGLTDLTKRKIIESYDKVLGLNLLMKEKVESDISEEYILQKIEERKEAKKEKNYVLADKIRDELLNKNIRLIDNKENTTYEFI